MLFHIKMLRPLTTQYKLRLFPPSPSSYALYRSFCITFVFCLLAGSPHLGPHAHASDMGAYNELVLPHVYGYDILRPEYITTEVFVGRERKPLMRAVNGLIGSVAPSDRARDLCLSLSRCA
jgi:hypothetical protein